MMGFNLSKEINERKVGAYERNASLKMCFERGRNPKPLWASIPQQLSTKLGLRQLEVQNPVWCYPMGVQCNFSYRVGHQGLDFGQTRVTSPVFSKLYAPEKKKKKNVFYWDWKFILGILVQGQIIFLKQDLRLIFFFWGTLV